MLKTADVIVAGLDDLGHMIVETEMAVDGDTWSKQRNGRLHGPPNMLLKPRCLVAAVDKLLICCRGVVTP